MKPIKTLIFTGYGINSQVELAQSFKKTGSLTDIKHINEIITSKESLKKYDILALAGGFSYGDHLGSGRVFANKLKLNLLEQLSQFANSNKPILGICNGFQTLVCLGLLPFDEHKPIEKMALWKNEKNQFENRWVNLKVNEKNTSFWIKNFPSHLPLPVRHAEGRCLFDHKKTLKKIKQKNLIAFFYANQKNNKTMQYPHNPNGSTAAIAGITNSKGNILGLMPHPEVYMIQQHHPNWKKQVINYKIQKPLKKNDGLGMLLFYNAIEYLKGK